MELEHLISREAPRGTILFDAVGIDVPSFCAFLKILSGNGLEYDSDDIDYNDPSRKCYHINGEAQPKEASGLTPPDKSPYSRVAYHQEKADHLRDRQVDLEAIEAELEPQR